MKSIYERRVGVDLEIKKTSEYLQYFISHNPNLFIYNKNTFLWKGWREFK